MALRHYFEAFSPRSWMAWPMRRMRGAGPGLEVGSSARVVRVTCSSGVVALETAATGVSGGMPEAMRDWLRAAKSRPGM